MDLNGTQKGIGCLGVVLLISVVILMITSTDWLDEVDQAITPYVRYDKDEHCNATGFGSADAQAITRIHIHWERGDVQVKYSSQSRITWVETFVEGEPTQYNSQYYWMNSHTLYIEFRNQEYFVMDQKSRQEIRKNLTVSVPQGVVLEELVIHNAEGQVSAEVQSQTRDIRCQ